MFKKLQDKIKGWAYNPDKDYCSGVRDKPLGFNFKRPCYVHDAYYRGYLKPNNPQYKKNPRKYADNVFYNLMIKCVDKQANNVVSRWAGYAIAYRRWIGVRTIGWRFWAAGDTANLQANE